MTKAEQAWRAAIIEIGCIVCYLAGYPGTPAVQHHLLNGGRRIGHMASIPLCEPGHHQYPPAGSGKIARHPTKAQFVKVNGTEEYLLEKTRQLVSQNTNLKTEAMSA